MKKFLIYLGIFGMFAIFFYIVVMPLWSSILPPFMSKNVRSCIGCYGHFFSRTQDAENIKNPDILFLGSSHSYRGFDTRVFAKHGLKTFNLGSSSQSPVNTNVLLKQYLEKMKPKLVIYDVYAGTLGIDGQESALDMLSNGKLDKNAAIMAFEINNLNTYNTLILTGFRKFFNLNKNFKENEKQGDDFYVKNGGFVETKFRENKLLDEKVRAWNINKKQAEKLKENIQILKENNTPYLLVQTPITQKLYNARTNNKEMDKMFSELGPYKNFYGELKLNDTTDFYDSNHLNQIAVERFNLQLIKYLKEHQFLK